MLATIMKYIPRGNGQNITEWSRFNSIIELRTDLYRTRFLSGPYMSSDFGKLITHILTDLNWIEIDKCPTDYAKYAYIDNLSGSYRAFYDPVYMNTIHTSLLTNDAPTYMLNTAMATPMRKLPMGQPWPAWSNIQPVHIIHHDAMELITDLSPLSLKFKGHSPTRVVANIDFTTMVMQYSKYREQYGAGTLGHPVWADYIQQVLVGSWYDDLRRIWLINILDKLLFDEDDTDIISSLTCDSNIINAHQLRIVYPDLNRIRHGLRQRNILVADALATPWFGIHTSPRTWISNMMSDFVVPDIRQYTYLRVMAELPYVKFTLKLNNLAGGSESVKLNRELLQLLNRYRDTNIYSSITDLKLRTKLQSEIVDLIELAERHRFR